MKLFEREHSKKNKTAQENKKSCRKVYRKNIKFRIALSETSESLILFGFSPSEFPTIRTSYSLPSEISEDREKKYPQTQ
ncbi:MULTISPECIES: hypothetical protein [Chryseobacterium]|uniref:Uncharacterized protein n=1 Tax=Candidatus Chryseobacterium massiliense TaxID=204089 RepID=A0A3D9AI61_9FLAO|nr:MULTISPECIES: hypothetical protein [Chryseobacterium]REC40686.1 hypothetical protein DRF68_19770 [Candidatus Chryseobacterium massiliae]